MSNDEAHVPAGILRCKLWGKSIDCTEADPEGAVPSCCDEVMVLFLPVVRRQPYPSDLADEQWARVQLLIPPSRGHRRVDTREVFNGILYRVRNDTSWRSLSRDLPPWQTVQEYFRLWQKGGTWAAIAEMPGLAQAGRSHCTTNPSSS